jgi:hypothetical protein
MARTVFTCPAGHRTAPNHAGAVICEPCNLVATWMDMKTGEVYQWRDLDGHRAGAQTLSDSLDDAFRNQYFPDW